ncbi:hypothetical protein O185_27015 [Photorhabdus temperata J3]|uniref:Uncharacterized protein n=1 Tax=Photorhabdus temperata J3 TaxID=1389415 RepID=U7QSA0_PHOTE|nr:hypothetical protein O185_27015 [Photorhabdus temperata J3]
MDCLKMDTTIILPQKQRKLLGFLGYGQLRKKLQNKAEVVNEIDGSIAKAAEFMNGTLNMVNWRFTG